MTLTQINYVIKIVECGSMNKAAEQLYVAQPSLTGAIKELEKELGFSLFNRSGKGVSLTVTHLLQFQESITQFTLQVMQLVSLCSTVQALAPSLQEAQL